MEPDRSAKGRPAEAWDHAAAASVAAGAAVGDKAAKALGAAGVLAPARDKVE